MDDVEGAGIFFLGNGKHAMFPCGKSQISNMFAIPTSGSSIKVFDLNDKKVFSNGQVDVFLDKCYQNRTGFAVMDGQGRVNKAIISSVLKLTNILFIHFNAKDIQDEASIKELVEIIQLIKVSK